VVPIGHPSPLRTIVDVDLGQYDEVCAAGGQPHYVFPKTFEELVRITGGEPTDVGS
jgi:prolyl-tRNA editing enzyme YbaK/EbsC (Cys-tRNA(Pro) deacylase)